MDEATTKGPQEKQQRRPGAQPDAASSLPQQSPAGRVSANKVAAPATRFATPAAVVVGASK